MVIYTEIQYTLISIYNTGLRQLKTLPSDYIEFKVCINRCGHIYRNPVHFDFDIQQRSDTTKDITIRLDSVDRVQ